MLDVAGHLTSFGWKGQGTALREGAITRPLLVSQKKSLAGLGKDRDEAFPFWDHVFAAAAKTINIKIARSDDGSDDADATPTPTTNATLERTATGILSNRRPTSATSTPGDSTPELVSDTYSHSKLSVMAVAKREAARRTLYANFYRAFVIKSEIDVDEPALKKRKHDIEDGGGTTTWRTLAATVTAPTAPTKTDADDEEDVAAQRRAKAERKAAKAERRAARSAKRERKRLKAERKAATQMVKDSGDATDPVHAGAGSDVTPRKHQKSKKDRALNTTEEDIPTESRPKKKRRKISQEL